MKRALITIIAVLSLTGGVASTVATVSDARSNNQTARAEDNDDKDHGKKCDDDRSKKSTPKACKDKDKDDNGRGHGRGHED